MSLWRQLSRGLRVLTHRRDADEDVADEVQHFIDQAAAEFVARGLSPEEARRSAKLEVGTVDLVREEIREHGWENLVGSFVADLRYGARMLRRSPSFTTVAVVTLALGIGANTAIFSIVNAVLLRPLPYLRPSRLVRIEEAHPNIHSINFSYASYIDLVAAHVAALESIAGYRFWTYNVTGGGEPEQVLGAQVSPGFFSVLGIEPQMGRGFLPDEDVPGNENVVVLSFGLWQRRFGGAPDVLGKTLQVSDVPHVVVGVMRAGFRFPESAEIWTPLVIEGQVRKNRRSHLLQVIGRLRPGTTLATAQAELTAFAHSVDEQNPGIDPGFAVAVGELQERVVAPVRPALLVLLGAVGFVLLVASANVGNLVLMRNARRGKEFAVRAALGAAPRRLARQLFAENSLLGAMGGAGGLVLARACLKLTIEFGPSDVPRLDQVTLDGRVLLVSFGISFAAALLLGLVPALQAAGSDPNDSLKEGGKGTRRQSRARLRNALVISEIALALVLLAGGGLLLNSLERLSHVELGFDPKNVLTLNLFFSPTRYSEAQIGSFLERVVARARALPGVVAAGSINMLPGVRGISTDFEIESRPNQLLGEEPSADICMVTPGYFEAMRIPLLRGRPFTAADSGASPMVMVISEIMARRYWPNESPIGKRVIMKDWGPPRRGEIVGVVGNVKSEGLDSPTQNMIYWPVSQFAEIFHNIVIRTTADPRQIVAAAKSEVWTVDPNQPISSIKTMEEVLADSLARRRLQTVLVGTFAALALVMASVGVYGVMAYSLSTRYHEIGIRMALGANASAVRTLVVREGMRLTVIGIAIGMAGAFGATRFLQGMLYGVRPTDPLTLVAVAVLLAAVAMLACWVPAWRASRVDPLVVLKYE